MKRFFNFLWGRSSSQKSGEPPVSPHGSTHLAWIEAEQSPYPMRVLDCRSVCRSMVSTTKDQSVAMRFAELRQSTGERHRGKAPANVMVLECDLRYPHQGEARDGPLFVAEVMEDKWDIFLLDGHLYFARSWTGDLVFRAKVAFEGEEVVISRVEANSKTIAGDGALAVRQVDFLVKSHLFMREVPHPLPAGFPDNPEQIALYSFAQYGRWGSFATYEDTTLVGV